MVGSFVSPQHGLRALRDCGYGTTPSIIQAGCVVRVEGLSGGPESIFPQWAHVLQQGPHLVYSTHIQGRPRKRLMAGGDQSVNFGVVVSAILEIAFRI